MTPAPEARLLVDMAQAFEKLLEATEIEERISALEQSWAARIKAKKALADGGE